MRKVLIAVAGLVALAGVARAADDMRSRIDTWSSYVIVAASCGEIGYRVHEEALNGIASDAGNEAEKAGISAPEMSGLIEAGNARHKALIEADQNAMLTAIGNASGDDDAKIAQIKAALSTYVARIDARCAKAALDPLFSRLIEAPSPEVLAAGKQDFLDRYLEGAGAASWQTAHVKAQGNLLYTVGACTPRLTATQLSGYKSGVVDGPTTTDPAQLRLRKYYAGELAAGQSRAAALGLSAARCAEVLAEDSATLKATP